MTLRKPGGITTAGSPWACAPLTRWWSWRKDPPLGARLQKPPEAFAVGAAVWQSSAQLSLPMSCSRRDISPSGWLLRIADPIQGAALLQQRLLGAGSGRAGGMTQPRRGAAAPAEANWGCSLTILILTVNKEPGPLREGSGDGLLLELDAGTYCCGNTLFCIKCHFVT